ncbi:MAG: DUF4124 domain-containing protein [Haliea sp.]|nr:DUF4124 domain-containing protein [Haliea sp.]
MRLHGIFCILFVAPILCGAGSPQVYQSKDADGNVVFSDKPSDGAEVITVTPTNTADPVQHIPALAAPDKQVDPAPPATKLTTTPSRSEEEDAAGDDTQYWIGNDEDDLEDRDNGLRDRGPGPERPIADRPRVQPLPSGVRPAPGGAARR